MSRWTDFVRGPGYFLGLACINTLHRWLPFALRPLLYRACGYRVAAGAGIQGGVRFFHIGRLSVGAGTRINRGVYLDNRGGIEIGAHVSIAHDARIYTMGHDVHDDGFVTQAKPVRVDDHVAVFAGALIMPGVHLGRGAVVMAGAVVTRDVPERRIVGGNPARDLGERRGGLDYRLAERNWFAH